MKRGTCPKCGGRELWVVDALGAKDGSVTFGGKLELKLVLKAPAPPPSGSWFGPADHERYYDVGTFDAWICRRCGFTEMWARDLDGVRPGSEGIRGVGGS